MTLYAFLALAAAICSVGLHTEFISRTQCCGRSANPLRPRATTPAQYAVKTAG